MLAVWLQDVWLQDVWLQDVWLQDVWLQDVWLQDVWLQDVWLQDVWVINRLQRREVYKVQVDYIDLETKNFGRLRTSGEPSFNTLLSEPSPPCAFHASLFNKWDFNHSFPLGFPGRQCRHVGEGH